MGSPITTWDGAEAYFTGAHSSLALTIFLVLAVVACFAPIVECALHETKAYEKATRK